MNPNTEYTKTASEWSDIIDNLPENEVDLWEKVDMKCDGHRLTDPITIELTPEEAAVAGLA